MIKLKYSFSKYGAANKLELLRIHLNKDFGFHNKNNTGTQ